MQEDAKLGGEWGWESERWDAIGAGKNMDLGFRYSLRSRSLWPSTCFGPLILNNQSLCLTCYLFNAIQNSSGHRQSEALMLLAVKAFEKPQPHP